MKKDNIPCITHSCTDPHNNTHVEYSDGGEIVIANTDKKNCIYNERGQCQQELGHRSTGEDCTIV